MILETSSPDSAVAGASATQLKETLKPGVKPSECGFQNPAARQIAQDVVDTIAHCLLLQGGAVQANLLFIAYPSLRRKFEDLRLFEALAPFMPRRFEIQRSGKIDWLCLSAAEEVAQKELHFGSDGCSDSAWKAPVWLHEDRKRAQVSERDLFHAVQASIVRYFERQEERLRLAAAAGDDGDQRTRLLCVPLAYLVKENAVKRKLNHYVLLNPDPALMAHRDESLTQELGMHYCWWGTLMLHLRKALRSAGWDIEDQRQRLAGNANFLRICEKASIWKECPCLEAVWIRKEGDEMFSNSINITSEQALQQHDGAAGGGLLPAGAGGDAAASREQAADEVRILALSKRVEDLMKGRSKLALSVVGKDKAVSKLRSGKALSDLVEAALQHSGNQISSDKEDNLSESGNAQARRFRLERDETTDQWFLFRNGEKASHTTGPCEDGHGAKAKRTQGAPEDEDDFPGADEVDEDEEAGEDILNLTFDPHEHLRVIHKSEHIVAVAKPAGFTTEKILKELHLHGHKLDGEKLDVKSVSRLDKMTSGVLIAAIGHEGVHHLKGEFKTHRVDKCYMCLCYGKVPFAEDEEGQTGTETSSDIAGDLASGSARFSCGLPEGGAAEAGFRSISMKLRCGTSEYRVYPSHKGKEAKTLFKTLAWYRRCKLTGAMATIRSCNQPNKDSHDAVSAEQNTPPATSAETDSPVAAATPSTSASVSPSPRVEQKGGPSGSELYEDPATDSEFYSLVLCKPVTGRTHQIRVHMKTMGFPLVSDVKYGSKTRVKRQLRWCPRLFLHCYELTVRNIVQNSEAGEKSPSDCEDATQSDLVHLCAPLSTDLLKALRGNPCDP